MTNSQRNKRSENKTVICSPLIFVRSQIKPTPIYNSYWRFATERQAIFFRRLYAESPPWTSDPIFQKYKFTNAYRASDRVSQYLIRNVIYDGDQAPEEQFFRIILFKLFNKIETWELLKAKLGEICFRNFNIHRYDHVLTQAFSSGVTIYSAAYIMPSGSTIFRVNRKHRAHLMLLKKMMEDRLPFKIAECNTMKDAFSLLRACPMIGDFLAYQYVTDINYSTLTNFSESEFVVPGPGALSGVRRCFVLDKKYTEADLIHYVADVQEKEFERRDLKFQSLWDRPLQLIDCQNLFCEVDKFARAKFPDISAANGRKRIKQLFRPSNKPLSVWYPPKWKLNDKIKSAAVRNIQGHFELISA
jgi:hypothetical protein